MRPDTVAEGVRQSQEIPLETDLLVNEVTTEWQKEFDDRLFDSRAETFTVTSHFSLTLTYSHYNTPPHFRAQWETLLI